ncbi:DUF6882 domain-containing protein [Actinomycetes bacterium KLBMP 9759]
MTQPLNLVDVLDDAALMSLEHQIHLSEVLGEHQWFVDLEEERFSFTGARTFICTGVHLLGSAAPGPRSWLWSWANPAGYSPRIVGVAESVREFGRTNGLSELSSPEVPFDMVPAGNGDPASVARVMVEVAKVVTGRWTSYTGDAGHGTHAAFLVEHPDFLLPAPEPARILRVLHQALAEVPLTDHRRAVHSYSVRRGLPSTFSSDFSQLVLTGQRFTVTVSFDPQGRVAHIGAGQT